jgi:hypothetical protein
VVIQSSLALANFFECGDRVISRGVSGSEVASVCGKPDQVDDNSAYNTAIAPVAGVPYAGAASAARVKIEVWTYNFGPDRVMERVHFVDGRVTDIEDLGFGRNGNAAA